MQKHSLVTITSRDGAQVPIPHIGGRTPLVREMVPQHIARSIAEQGLHVEVHVADYSREGIRAASAEAEAKRTKTARRAAELAAADDKSETAAADLPEQAAAPEHDPHSPTAQPVQEIVADGEPPAPEPEPAPPPGAGSAELAPTSVPDAVADEGTETEHSEGETLTDLRARVEALKTIADAQAVVAEYSIDLGESPPTTLKGIKQAVLEMIDVTEAETKGPAAEA